jgi:hypothetical protein
LGNLLYEWRTATWEHYISVERYKEAKEWLREQLKLHYDRGHPEVFRIMDAESPIEKPTIDVSDQLPAGETEPAVSLVLKPE